MFVSRLAVALLACSLVLGYTEVQANDSVNEAKTTQQTNRDELHSILIQILKKLDSVDLRLRQLEEQLNRHGATPKKSETNQQTSNQQIEDLLRLDPLYSHAAQTLKAVRQARQDRTYALWPWPPKPDSIYSKEAVVAKSALEQRRRELTPMIIHQLKKAEGIQSNIPLSSTNNAQSGH